MFRLTNLPHTTLPAKQQIAAPALRLWQGASRQGGVIGKLNRSNAAELDLIATIEPIAIADYYYLTEDNSEILTDYIANSIGLNSYWLDTANNQINLISLTNLEGFSSTAKVLVFAVDLLTLEFVEWMGKTYLPVSDILTPQIGEFIFFNHTAFLFTDLFNLRNYLIAQTAKGISRLGTWG